MTICYTLELMPCSAIFEKLPPVADWKKYRDPQPHNTESERLGTLNSKRDVLIKSSPWSSGNFRGRGGGKNVRARHRGHQAIKAF